MGVFAAIVDVYIEGNRIVGTRDLERLQISSSSRATARATALTLIFI